LVLLILSAMFNHSAPATAQSEAAGPTFDVVSIKRNTSEIGPGYRSNFAQWRPDGGLTIINVTVGNIIARAYPGTVPADIAGLPGWERSERFDVNAASMLTQATLADRTAMLRAMLADRFKLAAHFEKRQQPAYDLVLARKDGQLGQGLRPVDVDCTKVEAERAAAAESALNAGTLQQPPQGFPDFKSRPPCTVVSVGASLRDRGGDGQGRLGDLMQGEGTMDNLANTLRFTVRRRVVNKTGLVGTYRVTMNFDMMSAFRGPTLTPTDGAPSVFTAVREQLGLNLESSHIELDTLVIDRVERPTEN
jgi:uncharacterized protein (TIGR03435 family)